SAAAASSAQAGTKADSAWGSRSTTTEVLCLAFVGTSRRGLPAAAVPGPCVAFLGSIAGLIAGLLNRAKIDPTSTPRSAAARVVSRPGRALRSDGLRLNSRVCDDKAQIDGTTIRQGSPRPDHRTSARS